MIRHRRSKTTSTATLHEGVADLEDMDQNTCVSKFASPCYCIAVLILALLLLIAFLRSNNVNIASPLNFSSNSDSNTNTDTDTDSQQPKSVLLENRLQDLEAAQHKLLVTNSNNANTQTEKTEIKPKLRSANEAALTSNTANKVDESSINLANELAADSSCSWRPDVLVGRCFGLRRVDKSQFPDAWRSVQGCMAHCCSLSDDVHMPDGRVCVTFQFHRRKGCFVGRNVRLGLEAAKTPNWCEPVKPAAWTGFRLLERRTAEDAEDCDWDEQDELDTQCFGFGPEIAGVDSAEACARECCRDEEKCSMWQFRGDKGCFTGKAHSCDDDNDAWFGMRKVIDEI